MKFYQRAVLACVGLLSVAAIGKNLYDMTAVTPTMADLENLPAIVIDPGHGGVDGGAVGADNIVEKDINLSICLMLRDMFTACGFEVVMTRDTDISIHDEGITSTRKQKTSDLHNRLAIVEAQPNTVFLSIHQNKFGDSSSRGTQIFFGPENERSERLATILQEDFIANLQPENKRRYKKAGKNLYLMYNAKCPSVLVECGFLSNPEEARKLTDPDYQSRIAFTILGGVVKFLELDAPALDVQGTQAFALESTQIQA